MQSVGTIAKISFEDDGRCIGEVYHEVSNLNYKFNLSTADAQRLNYQLGETVFFDRSYTLQSATNLTRIRPESTVAAAQASSTKGSFFTPWRVGAIVLLGATWLYMGMPSPLLFFSRSQAEQECLRLARDNLDRLMPLAQVNDVASGSSWIRDGRRVVELIMDDNSSSRQYIRLCIYGRGTVQIPSIIEQGRWR